MNDYLTALAAKTLNLTEVVQPRLASLFEPPEGVYDPALRASFGLDTVDDEPFADKTAWLPSVTPPTERVGASWLSISGLEISPEAPQPNDGTGVSMRQPLSSLSTTQSIKAWPAQRSPHSASDPAQLHSTHTQAPDVVPVVAQSSDSRAPHQPRPDQPVQGSIAIQPETGSVPSGSADERGGQAALEPNIQPAVAQRIAWREGAPLQHTPPLESSTLQSILYTPPATGAAQPHVAPYIEPAAPAPAKPGAMPEPPPTIQVRIGRVEVRAIMSPAPPPRPKPPRRGPTLSLDEYLKQRNGGQR
jgi:hypothetical protein